MIYAIGDIHGRFDLLQKLYNQIIDDIKAVNDSDGAKIIFLGDYVDRGPESKQVMDFIMNLSDYDHENVSHLALLGNHELMMYDSWTGQFDGNLGMWLMNGGIETLESFNIPVQKEIIQGNSTLRPYAAWIETLPIYAEIGSYIFCHSGYLDPEKPLDGQYNSLLWGRPSKGRYVGFNKTVVHGHTPQLYGPEMDVNRINVDVGCGHSGINTLAAVVLPLVTAPDKYIRFIQV